MEDGTTVPFAEWAVVEFMGHRRFAGWVSEYEFAGKGFLRLDVPADEKNAAATQLYNPSAVYAITPTTEEMARAVAADCRPAPVQRWELERLKPITTTGDGFDDEGPF